jgi:hypothetical protein
MIIIQLRIKIFLREMSLQSLKSQKSCPSLILRKRNRIKSVKKRKSVLLSQLMMTNLMKWVQILMLEEEFIVGS